MPELRWLLTGCGEEIEAEDEGEAVAYLCATATLSSLFEMQVTVVQWLIDRGLSASGAKAYMDSFLRGFAAEFTAAPVVGLEHLTRRHETPGGLNEQVR